MPLNRVDMKLDPKLVAAVRNVRTVARRIERNKRKLLDGLHTSTRVQSRRNKSRATKSTTKEDVAQDKSSGEVGGYGDRENGAMDFPTT